MAQTNAAKRILVIQAHPDDADFHAGGTIAGWTDAGHHVHYLIFTRGDKGHDDPNISIEHVMALRQSEQEAAATTLGVQQISYEGYRDGDLAWAGAELTKQATMWIRRQRPDLVVTHDPYAGPPDYRPHQLHPDHRAVGFAVLDAIYFRAPGPLFHPELLDRGLEPHRVGEVYLIMGNHIDHFVDISATFERKVAALRAHHTQWGHHPDLEGLLRMRAREYGELGGLALAEGFKRLTPT